MFQKSLSGLVFCLFLVLVSGTSFAAITPQLQYNNSIDFFEHTPRVSLHAKYSYIRSYPGGGGIFIVYIEPENGFSGNVYLRINADQNLGVEVDTKILNMQSRVAEITLRPTMNISFTTYSIEVSAFYSPSLSPVKSAVDFWEPPYGHHPAVSLRTLYLDVEIFDHSSCNLPDAIVKRDELVTWLEAEHPEFGMFSNQDFFAYVTYPEILVVEHWTFLYDDWEMRICYHVMMPPYDWSKIWLRPRGEINAVFAAYRESDGTTYEIPVSEYPSFFGY